MRSLLFASALLLCSAISVNAAPIEMKVTLPREDNARCPEKVTLNETSRPYQEGSYTIDGSANLNAIADNFNIAASDDFSVTWVGKLKPAFSKCKATAGMTRIGRENFDGHSYLRLQFVNGKAYLILDMTGKIDPNELTPVILEKSVRNGNPTWTWGGTD